MIPLAMNNPNKKTIGVFMSPVLTTIVCVVLSFLHNCEILFLSFSRIFLHFKHTFFVLIYNEEKIRENDRNYVVGRL